MEQNSTSAFARLLATEDIRVQHLLEAETASFDVVDRVLTLPKWKNMSANLYDMLIGHEVAHALWTPGDLAEDGEHLAAAVEIDPDNPMRAMGFLNVVEDARIERLIKDKYPGIRRDFVSGYRWLWDNMDLFQTVIEEQGGISNMMLTDRLNLHFKLGIMGIITVPFSDEERTFVDRMERTVSFDDVMDLTRDLYEHEKNAAQDRPQTSQVEMDEIGEGEDQGDARGMSRPKTEDVLGGGLDQLRQKKRTHRDNGEGPSVMPTPNLDTIVVDHNEIEELLTHPRTRWDNDRSDNEPELNARDAGVEKARNASEVRFSEWVQTETKTVNYLVKQFELRKAADEHKRTMITKSGRLDTVKMINYKWSEDIFGKNMIVREGKNRGFVFMLGWSGSMGEVMEPTVKQALLLCMFCQKAGVPFELYAFSSTSKASDGTWFPKPDWEEDSTGTISRDHWVGQRSLDATAHNMVNNMQMLHFLSSSRDRRTQTRDMKNLFYLGEALKGRYCYDALQWNGGSAVIHCALDLGGTPLDEGIICLHHLLPEFRRRSGVQILNAVILTDGDGHCHMNDVIYNPILRRNFGDHPTHGDRPDTTTSLLLSLKETTGCNLIGMYLYAGVQIANCYGWFDDGDNGDPGDWRCEWEAKSQFIKDAQRSWKKENFFVATGHKATAYDEAYIIAATKEIEDEIDIPDDASHAKMRNAFVKGMAQRSMSRILSNRLVDRIAC
jgi:hypothetical protein